MKTKCFDFSFNLLFHEHSLVTLSIENLAKRWIFVNYKLSYLFKAIIKINKINITALKTCNGEKNCWHRILQQIIFNGIRPFPSASRRTE